MTEDIHAMYAEKQKKYQDYLVEKRVHEQKLASASESLRAEIAEMVSKLTNKEDSMSIQLLNILRKYTNEDLQTASTVAALKTELQEISKTLETQIREALA